MSRSADSTAQLPTPGSKRNPTACEQCRLARVKCRASGQPGVCERCLNLKRECVSRARARPRRWERKWGTAAASSASPPLLSPANDTFRIHYSVPVQRDLDDNFETLCQMHEQSLDGVLFEECPVGSPLSATSKSTASAPGSSPSRSSRSDIWRQPVFNTASAESLLHTFHSMLSYLPFLSLPPDSRDSSIASLSTKRPFTLLSILTVTSGLRTAQQHALYDDEFRKAVGLKYVSGGETSLEMLQGLLIYCAWYPFHLRPKNGQLLQYLRMASGLVRDLRLDENFLETSGHPEKPVATDELEKIRAYLAYIYLISTYITIWRGKNVLPDTVSPWTTIAVDTLKQNACTDGDHTLVALVRLSVLFSDISSAVNGTGEQAARTSSSALSDLRQQYRELQDQLAVAPAATKESKVLRQQMLFVDIFLDCGSLLAFPVFKRHSSAKSRRCPPPMATLCNATKKLHSMLRLYQEEGPDNKSSLFLFTINDWTRLIVVLTLAFRMSFPLSSCPEFDSTGARSEIRLDEFLSSVSSQTTETSSTGSNDIITADRAVLGVVKAKFDRRLALLEEPTTSVAPPVNRMYGCPMMDAGFRRSTQQWDPDLPDLSWLSTEGSNEEGSCLQFQDIWEASMIMDWESCGGDMAPWLSSEPIPDVL